MTVELIEDVILFKKDRFENLKEYLWGLFIGGVGYLIFSFEFSFLQIMPFLILFFLIGGRGTIFNSVMVKATTKLEFRNSKIFINDIYFDDLKNLNCIDFVSQSSKFHNKSPTSSIRLKSKNKYRLLINWIRFKDSENLKSYFKENLNIKVNQSSLVLPLI